MADRTDPLGGWFNIGDRVLTTLPSSTEARVNRPAASESVGMQRREGKTVTEHIAATAFTPLDWNLQYTKNASGELIALNPTNTNLSYALPQLTPGAVITQICARVKVKTPNDINRYVLMDIVAVDDDATATVVSAVTHQNAANVYETHCNPVSIVAQPDTTYFIKATILWGAAGDTNADARLLWVEVTYRLPG